MYNPYQNQGNGLPGNNFSQQGQPMQQNMQQFQQTQQQQQPQQSQQGYMGAGIQNTGMQNAGYNPGMQQQGMNQQFGASMGMPGQQQQQQQPQQQPMQTQSSMPSLSMPTSNLQPQSSNSYYPNTANQTGSVGMQATGMGGNSFQSQPLQQSQSMTALQPMQPQGTGYYNNSAGASSATTPAVVQPLQSQGTGYFPNPAQAVQPALTAQSAPIQPLQPQATATLQPLLPQQTGFYAQQYQVPLEPLKPTATGFVNSFANNGLNNDIKIPAIRLSFITAKDQAKFETLFRASVQPGSNTITGKGCRAILMKSGLAPTQLAKIWTLCDTSKAGELLFPEFALAMHLVNDVLQGDSIPYELDTKTKNEVNSFIDAINLSIASGESSSAKTPFDELMAMPMQAQNTGMLQAQNTGMIPQTSFGMPAQMTGGMLNPQSTGYIPQTSFGMPPQLTGGLMPQTTGGMTAPNMMVPQTSFGAPLQGQLTGGMGMQPQLTGSGMNMGIQPQVTGGYSQPAQMAPQVTGSMGMPQLTFGQGGMPQQQQQPMGLQPQATGYLPPSNFNPTAPLVAQKTGFGNNEIYAQNKFTQNLSTQMNQQEEETDSISSEEKSLFYKIFETYDNKNTGLIDSPTAVEIFRKSGLNRSDLEHIWNLCDTNNSGQLNKQEFALGMHLVYRKLNNQPIPNRLPPSLIPSSNRILDNLKTQLKSSGNGPNNSGSRINGLGYKNNDDENSLPTFRNRRKNFSTTNTTPSPQPTEATSVSEAAEKYPDINSVGQQSAPPPAPVQEKAAPAATPAAATQQSSAAKTRTSTLEEDVKRITEIRYELESLQLPSISSNSQVPTALQKRFDSIINTVPELFAEIADVDSKITKAKMELVSLKSGTAIEGTGPGGEVTENDKKKAKSRAILKARMAALTGKSSDNNDDNDKQNEEELAKIREESAKNQEIIKDIRYSISDISSSLKAIFTGKDIYNDGNDFEKWEFGSGLEKEVRDFIKDLNKFNEPVQSSSSGATTTTSTASDSKSSGDRAAYLKEQAQKRMKERLAKFGINKRGDRSRSNTSESIKTPFEVEDDSSAVSTPPVATTPTVPTQQPVQQHSAGQENDDEEDEEEKKLREKLEALKLKKKADKERRLAELRKQIEDAEAESDDDDTTNSQPVMTKTINLNAASNNTASYSQPAAQAPPASNMAQPAQQVPAQYGGAPQAQINKPNPFFKQEPNSAASSFDSRIAEQQRMSQRGLSNDDDGWSDDEEEKKPAATQAAPSAPAPIAAPVPTPAPAPIAAPVPTPAPAPIAAPIPQVQSPAVPVAPPIPQIQSETPPVPMAPPIPQIQSETPPVPMAPPIPQIQEQTPAVPVAPPIPQVQQEQAPPVPVAPPIPQVPEMAPPAAAPVAPPAAPAPAATDDNEWGDDDDVLSIPDSVDSGDDFGSAGISSIPPPPPLP